MQTTTVFLILSSGRRWSAVVPADSLSKLNDNYRL
jgi:hypothetical protein